MTLEMRRDEMRYGTSHFAQFSHAVRYYKGYGLDAKAVQRKLDEGEIHIGAPEHKPTERLYWDKKELRYFIDDMKP